MNQAKKEKRHLKNNIPLPIECLFTNSSGEGNSRDAMWLHYHEYIEILYPLKGEFEVMINGEYYPLKEHSLIVINAMEPHAVRSVNSGDRTQRCIKFLPQVLFSSEQSVTGLEYTIPYISQHLAHPRLFESDILDQTFIPAEFEYIDQELQTNDFASELTIRSSVLKIFAWILRYWHTHSSNELLPVMNQALVQNIRKIQDYVETHYTETTLTKAAQACGFSYSYFSRIFNSYMNTSFSEYVNKIRVDEAMKLLASTDMSITDISLTVGFSSSSYFIQTFKKYKHLSPNKFRTMLRKEKE
jgi:AraC-like DNA-binding protein